MSSITWAVILLAGLTLQASGLGTQVNLSTRPSTVQIEYRALDGWSQQCVGNLVSSLYIVSAASCFQDVNSNRRIRAGAEVRGTGGYIAEIASVVNHHTYDPRGNDGDITLITVQNYIPPGPTTMPVAIVPQDYYLTPQQTVSIVGWGSTAEGGILGNNYLYSLDLITKDIFECQNQYTNLDNPRNLTSNMICVGLSTYGGRDLDYRDTGAPIFYQSALAGVVSFGVSRGQDATPVVATAIGSYSDWIIATAANTI